MTRTQAILKLNDHLEYKVLMNDDDPMVITFYRNAVFDPTLQLHFHRDKVSIFHLLTTKFSGSGGLVGARSYVYTEEKVQELYDELGRQKFTHNLEKLEKDESVMDFPMFDERY